MIPVELFLAYDKQGLFPAPSEALATFVERTQRCLALRQQGQTLAQEVFKEPPATAASGELALIAEQLCAQTELLYGMSPRWAPLFFSNEGLLPWHGGCCCVVSGDEEANLAFLQLRSHFLKHERFLGLYSRSELLLHEAAHLGRMAFNEPCFEELLAYQSSGSWLHRWLGPLFSHSWEPSFLLLLPLLFPLIALCFSLPPLELPWLLLGVALPPFLFLSYLAGRLAHRFLLFYRCRSQWGQLLPSEKLLPLLYRLSDEEIVLFAQRRSKEEWLALLQEKRSLSWRWELLWAAHIAPYVD